jgi:hypothetical protein
VYGRSFHGVVLRKVSPFRRPQNDERRWLFGFGTPARPKRRTATASRPTLYKSRSEDASLIDRLIRLVSLQVSRAQDSCAFILDRLFKLERAQSNADMSGPDEGNGSSAHYISRIKIYSCVPEAAPQRDSITRC